VNVGQRWYIEYIKIGHKSTLAVPKYFPKILVTFKINNLATSDCVKDWGKVAPGRTRVGKPSASLGQGMLNLFGKVRLSKVYLSGNYKDCMP